MGARAFEDFLAAADRHSAILAYGTDPAYKSEEALRFLYAAVDELQAFAERQDLRTRAARRQKPGLPPDTNRDYTVATLRVMSRSRPSVPREHPSGNTRRTS